MGTKLWLVAICALLTPMAAGADLAERMGDAVDGTYRMEFEAREGVSGTSSGGINLGDTYLGNFPGSRYFRGPVAIEFTLRDGRIRSADVFILDTRGDSTDRGIEATGNTRSRSVIDLGRIPSAEAALWLLDQAGSARASAGGDVVTAAALARNLDAVPHLEHVAANPDIDSRVRGHALFWLSTFDDPETLDAIIRVMNVSRDDDVREKGIFALSQRPELEAVEQLKTIALQEDDRELRQKAVFWLGQSEHPEAMTFLEDLILN